MECIRDAERNWWIVKGTDGCTAIVTDELLSDAGITAQDLQNSDNLPQALNMRKRRMPFEDDELGEGLSVE